MASVYTINKGINKPVEFRGFKAQYIWWLASGMIIILVFFALMYIAGINPFFCVGFAFASGTLVIVYVRKLSAKYGEHGMMKALAKRMMPKVIKSYSRKVFFKKQNA